MRSRDSWTGAGSTLVMGLLLWSVAPWAAEPLQDAMSPEDFSRAGLQRLSVEELAYLNRWLGRTNSSQPAHTFGAEQLQTSPLAEEATPALRTRVEGEFSGWSGRTVFRLANGQVWQQRLPGKYVFNARNPEVILKRGRFGYYLELVSSGRQIAVKRLK